MRHYYSVRLISLVAASVLANATFISVSWATEQAQQGRETARDIKY